MKTFVALSDTTLRMRDRKQYDLTSLLILGMIGSVSIPAVRKFFLL